jgi:hypothetical protein
MLSDCDSFGEKSGREEKCLGFLCSCDGDGNKIGRVGVNWVHVSH